MTRWTVTISGGVYLTVEDVWPDGDAPENPTEEDVVAVMHGVSSVWSALEEYAVTVARMRRVLRKSVGSATSEVVPINASRFSSVVVSRSPYATNVGKRFTVTAKARSFMSADLAGNLNGLVIGMELVASANKKPPLQAIAFTRLSCATSIANRRPLSTPLIKKRWKTRIIAVIGQMSN